MLKKSHDKFDIRLLMLNLVARLISTHKLVLLNYYPFVRPDPSPAPPLFASARPWGGGGGGGGGGACVGRPPGRPKPFFLERRQDWRI